MVVFHAELFVSEEKNSPSSKNAYGKNIIEMDPKNEEITLSLVITLTLVLPLTLMRDNRRDKQ